MKSGSAAALFCFGIFIVKHLVVSEIIYNFAAGYRNQLKTAKV
jgi:hypothetical protein